MLTVDAQKVRAALRHGRERTIAVSGLVHTFAYWGLVPGTLCRSHVWSSDLAMPSPVGSGGANCAACQVRVASSAADERAR